MVDPLGLKPAGSIDRRPVAAVGEAARAPAVPAGTQEAASRASEASALARSLAASPPVDAERVARIRAAIRDGSFPLVPTTVADRLLALKLDWNPNEQA